MGSFLNKLFQRFTGRQSQKPGEIHLAVFGKHPGWDDHVEIGLDTENLAALRQSLYVEGIAGNIDGGKWNSLAPEGRITEFDHSMLWCMKNEIHAARLWSSRDGKGRDRYPLVACAQCTGMPLPWVARVAIPVLDRLRVQCQETTSAEGVTTAVAESLNELRSLAAARQASVDAEPDPPALPLLLNHPELGENHRGLLAAIYHLERTAAGDPAHLRVPACADTFTDAAQVWLRFLLDRGGVCLPVIAIQSTAAFWLDLIIGTPRIGDFFCFLASPAALPLTTDIPYTLEPAFIAQARASLGLPPDPSTATPSPTPAPS